MKASKSTESARQAFILKQGEEGTPVAEICRKAGISQATYFNWKKRYGGCFRTKCGCATAIGVSTSCCDARVGRDYIRVAMRVHPLIQGR